MIAVKVVLQRPSSGQELELGPFHQGVVIERERIIDVASDSEIVYRSFGGRWRTASEFPTRDFVRVFVQGAGCS